MIVSLIETQGFKMTSTERVVLHRNRKKAEVFAAEYMDSARLATVEQFLKAMVSSIEFEQDIVVECIAENQIDNFTNALAESIDIDGQYCVKDLFISWHKGIAVGKAVNR